MIDDEEICELLLAEIRERFPLYESVIETVGSSRVVTCNATGGAKGFLPYPVVEHDEFTSKSLRDVVDVVDALRRRGCAEVFLVFVDSGGSLTFYRTSAVRA
ncbi:hypothetical protein C3747_96g329c [Trypanosoma cruzi]|uniref:Uncharacterized protein n=2 Tax=Trypanosoma cruzi TaxID=5693 RepID=Q4D091_TRYCC|nr:hypothetical protein, conserved [Trypanosoma cruzi]EAN85942.1 hypothetical protein, conserved [Trypanosoma cruzi]PWV07967.1 hypothetical protein C3747_96g329c [Trypanosoma cruzi]RNC54590.1 hypothetical protein TcCL_ESM07965 [Trypanosoma cruzi]|eukprot:XP_807793.1 hypothetical protein [Trypanosoma cruzi strain CL Brener]